MNGSPLQGYLGTFPNLILTNFYEFRLYRQGVRIDAVRIGGYQVCEKWLKDRKGRTLTTGGIRHYSGLVAALQKTLEIQEEIDNRIARSIRTDSTGGVDRPFIEHLSSQQYQKERSP